MQLVIQAKPSGMSPEATRHIAEQEQRVANSVRNGYDTTQAQKLLDNFYESHTHHIADRDRILGELGQ
ncbi:hypothetical protein EOW77_0016285 [Bradyrhizobium yuanmingense]|uniref:hypothetical protein n=1 Tax=Bradyrhizobium yuanmingense TaxID=108015 RepID=UPI000FE2EE65|nr:hypothetical protein [Bradyrhizobium yuanmingense]TGN86843.1 hypothetical protein EOW77_0016285 [Bradyrhizobium yuanmingense]